MKKQELQLADINNNLQNIYTLLEKLVSINLRAESKPTPWLTDKNRKKAEMLRTSNPDVYDYIIEVFKCYFTD
ncbi:MAG: hypothetical protein NC320_01045 [Clostridium sp.]|nr:hypothetical protein [Clostridium sp.]